MPRVTSTIISLNSISPQGGNILIVGSINSKPSGEGLATVLVTHKDQNNKNNPIEAVPEVEDPEKSRVSRRVKLLSGAELKKQLDEAKACPELSRRADLETALKTLGHPETGATCAEPRRSITKSQAEVVAEPRRSVGSLAGHSVGQILH